MEYPNRKTIRLKNYDYSQGGHYFVTICVHNHENLFGTIINDEMRLNEYGMIIENEWRRSGEIRQEIILDHYCVMPNHFHAIIIIDDAIGANGVRPIKADPDFGSSFEASEIRMHAKSLSSLIAGFKSSTTAKINKIR